jgi:multidrug resistance protein MdtO
MTTAVQTLEAPYVRRPPWPRFLRDELAPAPGRLNATIRIVVASLIVLVTSMTLEVPIVALSLFVVLFMTKLTSVVTTQNSVVVAIAGVLGSVVATLALVLTILIWRYTIDYPPLRLAAMASVFFIGMFAKRVFVLGAAGYVVAIVVLVSQAYLDLFPGPEQILRAVLWAWVAVVYPAVVTVGVNLLLLPADPEPLLRREAAERLLAVARALRAARGSMAAQKAAAELRKYAAQGSADLLGLMRLAEIRDPSVEPLRSERTAKIQLLGRLIEATALYADLAVEPSPAQRERLARAADEFERLAAAICSGAPLVAGPPPLVGEEGDPSSPVAPVLAEIEAVLRELPLAERPEDAQPAAGKRPFVADALSNPAHAEYALKVTLAAMLCYVAFRAIDWDGIHTCITTCAIVALSSAGETIQKATLRLVGCAIAGALALAAIVFLVPHMTSIVQLMLLVAAITAPAAWIAMGSERTAYLGVQLAFTFYLAVLQDYGPSADVTEFRDRFVGVVFGVVVMALVFAYLWPERAGTGMAQSLATALRRMSELADSHGDTRALRAAAWKALDESDRLGELFAFEPEAYASLSGEQGRQIRDLIDPARRVLLAQLAVERHRGTGATASQEADPARAVLGYGIAETLTGIANWIETGTRATHADLRAGLAALGAFRISASAPDTLESELALYAQLVDRVEALEKAVGA